MSEKTSRLHQVRICFTRCLTVFRNERGWKYFLTAGIMILLISTVTGENLFVTGQDTETGMFTLLSACIWCGIFHSLRSVCREREILKREHRTGLHISSYILGHWLYEACICLVLALLISILVWICNMSRYTKHGVVFPPFIEYTLTYFLILFASDSLGLLISSAVRSENTAMTVMPFALILQLIMSGLIFPLKGISRLISTLTVSRWGLNALCTTANVNGLDIFINKDAYEPLPSNLYRLWGLLFLFAVIYMVLSVLILEFIDYDKR